MKTTTRTFIQSILLLLAAIGGALHAAPDAPPSTQAAFSGAGGSYGGIAQTSDNNPLTAGVISLQLLDTGSFSGSVVFQGRRYPITGKFNASTAQFHHTFSVPQFPGFAVDVSATLDPAARTITGTFTELDFGFPTLTASFTLSGTLPDAVLGPKLAGSMRTSFIDPPNVASGEQEIPGDGFSVVTVGHSAKTRAARFIGRLNDYNAKYSSGSPLRGVDYTVFGSLYKKHGQTFGSAGVLDNGANSPGLNSTLNWGKKTSGDGYYEAGIDTSIFINGQVYPHVGKGKIVPIGTAPSSNLNATLRFKRGNLVATFTAPLAITPGHVKVGNGNPQQIKMTINAQASLFQGTFIHPDSGQLTHFQGTFQATIGFGTPSAIAGEGRGSFPGSVDPNNSAQTGPAESGSVRLTVTP